MRRSSGASRPLGASSTWRGTDVAVSSVGHLTLLNAVPRSTRSPAPGRERPSPWQDSACPHRGTAGLYSRKRASAVLTLVFCALWCGVTCPSVDCGDCRCRHVLFFFFHTKVTDQHTTHVLPRRVP
eukprot:1101826-Prymnesium_polylepis.1